MNKIELRVANLDFTATQDDKLIVEGVVNDGNWSQTLGSRKKFKERIEKGAFTRAINRALQNDKIDFLIEHDTSKILSSTTNDSLKLWEDENKGLCMRAVICPTSWGKDTFELIKSGIIKSMSFGFNVIKDEWSNTRSEVCNRVVKELNLLEVSAVRNPAYLSSAISARGLDLVEDVEIPNEVIEDVKVQEENIKEEKVVEQKVEEKTEQPNVEQLMSNMFKQFESMLNNYIPKIQQNSIEEVEEVEKNEEQIIEDKQEVVEKIEPQPIIEKQPIVEEQEVEEQVEQTVKSEIDYAIELLSKYKKIQELQK